MRMDMAKSSAFLSSMNFLAQKIALSAVMVGKTLFRLTSMMPIALLLCSSLFSSESSVQSVVAGVSLAISRSSSVAMKSAARGNFSSTVLISSSDRYVRFERRSSSVIISLSIFSFLSASTSRSRSSSSSVKSLFLMLSSSRIRARKWAMSSDISSQSL